MPSRRTTGTWFLREPRGETYKALLRLATTRTDRVVLVSPETPDEAERWMTVMARLAQYRLGLPRQSNSWPGTAKGRRSTVTVFRYSRALADALGQLADGLFDWQLPERPEDLSLLNGDKEWLVSVSHEEMCWIETTRDDFERLLMGLPGLDVATGPGFRGGSGRRSGGR